MRKAIISLCLLTGLILMASTGAAQAGGCGPGSLAGAALGGSASAGSGYRVPSQVGDAMSTGNTSGGVELTGHPSGGDESHGSSSGGMDGRTEPPVQGNSLVQMSLRWMIAVVAGGHPEPPIERS
jgi:hypothetical protein